MKRIAIISAALALLLSCSQGQQGARTTEDFNFDWKFDLSDSPTPYIVGGKPQYCLENFDDSQWRPLHLPHDWAVEGEFSKDNPSTPGGGALPGGVGWYRKVFPTPEGERVFLEFDGVFMNSTVYVNEQDLGTRPYGYSSFSYEITDCLKRDGSLNTIAVRCDNQDQPNSRWYAGCGIYRNVRLITTGSTRVAYSGIWITTPEVTDEKAVVKVETTLDGCTEGVAVEQTVMDAKGAKVAATDGETLEIAKPHRWDITDPYLYTLVTVVKKDGVETDRVETRFGVRTFDWDPATGFYLNGRNVKLLGVCLHHDAGCLGSAVHRRAIQRQLEKLQEMGCNSIRTSHNPPAPELLDLCDEMGLLVMDEAFDMWKKRKTQFDYARFFDDWHEKDLRDFMLRDRNHACIYAWSAGNEILEQWNSDEDNAENLSAEQSNLLMNYLSQMPNVDAGENNPNIILAHRMAMLVKSIDPTRPVLTGNNESKPRNNLFRSGAFDIYGINYHTRHYDSLQTWYPGKCLIGSETASAIQSRGYYPQPSTDLYVTPARWDLTYDTVHHQCPAYDNSRVPWGDFHEYAWTTIRDRDYIAGTYVWTGFDYIGEPTPYSWPSRSSYFGICDLAGFPKDSYYMYKSEWPGYNGGEAETVLHVFPHWNWSEGDKVDIWAYYNNADEVELFVNGVSAGKSEKTNEVLHAQWLGISWEPGTIEVVSYKDGKEVARAKRETAGEPVALRLTPDRKVIAADGYDLSYVTVEALDAEGRVVPTVNDMLHFSVSGAGELIGVDNGNAADTTSLKGSSKAFFNGLALGVVRSLKDQKGTATLTVEGLGTSASINIKVK